MTKFEEWKQEEIKNIQEMTIADFVFLAVSEEYPRCCNYCCYYYEKMHNKKVKCGKCADGIREYMEKEIK